MTLEISEVTATGPLTLAGHTVARGASFGTDGQPGSTITIPEGALLSVESSPFTFEDHLNVSGVRISPPPPFFSFFFLFLPRLFDRGHLSCSLTTFAAVPCFTARHRDQTVENVAPGGTMTFSGDGEFAFDDTAVLAAGPSNDIQLDAGAVIECAGCTVELTDATITGTAPSALRVSVAPALISGSGAIDISAPIELDGADLDIVLATPAGTAACMEVCALGCQSSGKDGHERFLFCPHDNVPIPVMSP